MDDDLCFYDLVEAVAYGIIDADDAAALLMQPWPSMFELISEDFGAFRFRGESTHKCHHCDEPIVEGEIVFPLNNKTLWMHQACMVRGIAGSVGCQKLGPGHAPGHADDSEDGLTKREAANRALAYWRLTNLR